MMCSKQIGKHKMTFVAEGENLWEMQMQMERLSFPDIYECGLCKSDRLHLKAYKAQEKYKYVKVTCGACRGSVTFGQKQEDPNVMYLRKNDRRRSTGRNTPGISRPEGKTRTHRFEEQPGMGPPSPPAVPRLFFVPCVLFLGAIDKMRRVVITRGVSCGMDRGASEPVEPSKNKASGQGYGLGY